MESEVLAAIIAGSSAIVATIINKIFPDSIVGVFRKIPHGGSLKGTWKSSWGPLPEGNLKYTETVKIIQQRGFEVKAIATRTENNIQRKWELRGRYDGQFLQLYYFPSKEMIDILDYGCYFLKKKADGSFTGYSTGFGNNDDGVSDEGITTDYHRFEKLS